VQTNKFEWWNPFTWKNYNEEPQYEEVVTVDYKMTTNENFDWSFSKDDYYRAAMFDVFNAEFDIVGEFVPDNSVEVVLQIQET